MAADPVLRILPYDARWPAEFAAEADRLRAALGPLALRIEHGSTSVAHARKEE
jgi:GrpB-like predicted nucleotidyltransferase (UPF0157 family)